jgi:hypothetical protein
MQSIQNYPIFVHLKPVLLNSRKEQAEDSFSESCLAMEKNLINEVGLNDS